MPAHDYVRPNLFTQRVFNPFIALITKLGISVWGSRVLRVQGRKTGRWYETPVNVLTLDGHRYLVAPRGETQWARNIRISLAAEIRVGPRRETIHVRELTGQEKVPVLRGYIRRWSWEAGQYFHGVRADASDPALAAEASRHPIFAIEEHATPGGSTPG